MFCFNFMNNDIRLSSVEISFSNNTVLHLTYVSIFIQLTSINIAYLVCNISGVLSICKVSESRCIYDYMQLSTVPMEW